MDFSIPRRRHEPLETLLWGILMAGIIFSLHFLLETTFEQRMAVWLAILFAAVIGGGIGMLFGHLMAKDGEVDTGLCRFIAWLNLVAWLLPIAGLCVCAMTTEFYRWSTTSTRMYKTLASIGAILSCLSAVFGVLLASQARVESAFPHNFEIADYGTERSAARCPYAAKEHWSKDDADKYCR